MTSGRGAATKIPDVMISKICDVIMDGDGEHNDLDRLVESALEAAGVGKLIDASHRTRVMRHSKYPNMKRHQLCSQGLPEIATMPLSPK